MADAFETAKLAVMAALSGHSARVMREAVLPADCPPEGLLNLAEGGDPEEDDAVLGTGERHWQVPLQLELVVQAAAEDLRLTRMNAAIAECSAALSADLTLGGAVDYLLIGAPVDADQIAMKGAASLRGAVLPITLFLTTSLNPLEAIP